jgi:hypothetical protein
MGGEYDKVPFGGRSTRSGACWSNSGLTSLMNGFSGVGVLGTIPRGGMQRNAMLQKSGSVKMSCNEKVFRPIQSSLQFVV